MTTLVEWLRDALDTHERIAREDAQVCLTSCDAPAIVLRTVQAHREILDLYAASVERDEWMRAGTGTAPLRMATSAYWEAVRRVAAIYRDHPGFDPSWIGES